MEGHRPDPRATDPSATSIHQVAASAGVSAGTVSRVINRDRRISEETRCRVLAVIAQLGYVSRPPAQRPGPRPHRRPEAGGEGRKACRIALLKSYDQAALNSPIYATVIDGIAAGAASTGVDLLVRRFQEVRRHRPRGVDGLIVFGRMDPAWIPADMPCVSIMSQPIINHHHDWVTYDDAAVGRMAADHLLDQGCTAAVVVANLRNLAPVDRLTAFLERCRSRGVEALLFEQPLMVMKDNRQTVDAEAMAGIGPLIGGLQGGPIGLFLTGDAFASPAHAALRRCGIDVGGRVRVVSVNNEREFLDGLAPRPASIDIHPLSVGRRAVEQLLWRMANPREPRVVVTFMPSLIGGDPPAA